MKNAVLVSLFVVLSSVFVYAAEPSGRYTFNVTSSKDGGNRQVVVGDTLTGNFEIYDVDNKGLDRKTNEEYYPCYFFDVRAKKRYVKKVKESTGEE